MLPGAAKRHDVSGCAYGLAEGPDRVFLVGLGPPD